MTKTALTPGSEEWRDLDEEDVSEDIQIEEYDLTSTPNDFNVLTISSFIESGAVKIPGFQRNYVWDIRRASKLIESLILGLPVPQVFLYEAGRNDFLVIDGQQRLLSIYFFVKQRFPRKATRGQLRSLVDDRTTIPDDVLADDTYFENFNLRLPDVGDGVKNKFTKLNYSTLGDYRTQFDLRTIRNIVVKQIRPSDDDSSIYEMFHRLNSGGVNLTPQEIRSSLYYSPFVEMILDANRNPDWRRLVNQPNQDPHLRDVEVLLRALAMARDAANYRSSMAKFLNQFAKKAKAYSDEDIAGARADLTAFFNHASGLPGAETLFIAKNGRFSVTLFESVFSAASAARDAKGRFTFDAVQVRNVREDDQFASLSQGSTSHSSNVAGRLRRAREILGA